MWKTSKLTQNISCASLERATQDMKTPPRYFASPFQHFSKYQFYTTRLAVLLVSRILVDPNPLVMEQGLNTSSKMTADFHIHT